MRLWKMNQASPGLAMARAFADLEGRSCGLISEPEITEHTPVPEDKAIIMGSDGIFEYMTNEEVADCVMMFHPTAQAGKACEVLVGKAATRWRQVKTKFITKKREN